MSNKKSIHKKKLNEGREGINIGRGYTFLRVLGGVRLQANYGCPNEKKINYLIIKEEAGAKTKREGNPRCGKD